MTQPAQFLSLQAVGPEADVAAPKPRTNWRAKLAQHKRLVFGVVVGLVLLAAGLVAEFAAKDRLEVRLTRVLGDSAITWRHSSIWPIGAGSTLEGLTLRFGERTLTADRLEVAQLSLDRRGALMALDARLSGATLDLPALFQDRDLGLAGNAQQDVSLHPAELILALGYDPLRVDGHVRWKWSQSTERAYLNLALEGAQFGKARLALTLTDVAPELAEQASKALPSLAQGTPGPIFSRKALAGVGLTRARLDYSDSGFGARIQEFLSYELPANPKPRVSISEAMAELRNGSELAQLLAWLDNLDVNGARAVLRALEPQGRASMVFYRREPLRLFEITRAPQPTAPPSEPEGGPPTDPGVGAPAMPDAPLETLRRASAADINLLAKDGALRFGG